MPMRNGAIMGMPRGGGTAFLRDLVYRDLSQMFTVEEEYRFDASRRWRFDLAVPAYKVAIEFQGGIWTGGRHVRGYGVMNEAEKILAAAAQGWVVIPVVYDHLRDQTSAVLVLLTEAVLVRRPA
jgi:hypothetical protein